MYQTIVDPYEVFASGETVCAYEFVKQNGCLLQCSLGREGRCVERLISTNPADYLNPAYQPGQILGK